MSVLGCREVHVCEKGFWEREESVHSRWRRAGVSAGSQVCAGRSGRGMSAQGCEVMDRGRAREVCAPEDGHVWRQKGVNTGGSGSWL